MPTVDEARALLVEAGCSPSVIEHVEAVASLALAMAEHAPDADRDVVVAGALLHDLGRAMAHGPEHVPKGVAWLRGRQVDERIVRCVARHMGAGITPAEAKALGWPTDTYAPETLEERIVCHADNLTFGTRHVSVAEVRRKFERRGLGDALVRLDRLHAGLVDELGIDPDEVVRGLA